MREWIERSFRNRIFSTVLLVALVPLLLCDVLMTQVMIARSERTLAGEAQEELAALGGALDEALRRSAQTAEELAASTVTRSALRRGGSDSRTLYQLLHRDTVALRAYADFEVYGAGGACLYTTAAERSAAARSTDWGVLCAAREAGGAVLRAEENALCGACAVRAHGGETLGYVLFRMDGAGLGALIAPLLRPSDDILLVDPTWRMVYSSQSVHADETLALLRTQLLGNGRLSGGKEDCGYYLCAGETGFSLILQQPRTYTAQAVRSIYVVAGAMGFLCFALCLAAAWILSRHLSEPVGELDSAMRRVEGGDYNVRIESARRDEMGRLAASFDRMTDEYRQNLARSVQRERELNETRLRMLQSQLNPHFLYNTLDCMKWLGVTGGVPQVAELAADLAALLRAGISGSERITLEQELELVSRYLAIQEVRFGDRFVCEIDVEDRFQHCVVPKLILQPLVENAIIHGVADSEEGYIKLWAEADGEDLLLKVSDNGGGMPDEVLRSIENHEQIPGGHLGLNNVDRIVRLSYGGAYGLSAWRNEGGGSCVQLRLPMKKGEKEC